MNIDTIQDKFWNKLSMDFTTFPIEKWFMADEPCDHQVLWNYRFWRNDYKIEFILGEKQVGYLGTHTTFICRNSGGINLTNYLSSFQKLEMIEMLRRRIKFEKENLGHKITKLELDALTDSIIEYLDRLSIVTIDIVTAVIDEVNILNELPTDFNVQPKYLYTLFKKEKNGWTSIASTEQNPFVSKSLTIGERVYFGNHLGLGEVVEINTLEKENPVFTTNEGAKKITYKIIRGFGNSVMH